MTLIEQRHPKLGQLMQLWRSRCRGDALPPASELAVVTERAALAPMTVLLARAGHDENQLTIVASGAEVDAIYGESLVGAPVDRLAPARDDAGREAWSAIETARPVVIEDELRVGDRRRRVARLYLPLANADGSTDGVLCGIVAIS